MSTLHLNQINKRLETQISSHIDMNDQRPGTSQFDDMRRSRALAAYIVHHFTDCAPEEAAKSVVDGSGDNGIDAIYFHELEEKLYLVQSKWIKDGKGEPDNGSIKKFAAGIRDLLGLNFERFNSRIQTREREINVALGIPGLKVVVVLVHSGNADLSDVSKRDLTDLEDEINDVSETLTWQAVNQSRLYLSLTEDLNSPITVEIPIEHWGKIQEPRQAIYGMVSASDLGLIWQNNKDRLVAKNLRGALGDSDVNKEIRQSLEQRPDQFWYFNNGITATAKQVTKLPKGGGKHELGYFHCEELYVVNGAQTVSTIGQFIDKNPNADLSSCYVQFRVIQLGEGGEDFGDEVTRTNNRQNKIEARDFVSQDQEQKRIRTELLIDNIDYQIMRHDEQPRGERVFDLHDSTTALACASNDITMIVALKNQIGKLWDDLSKAPYRTLFNPNVSSSYVWNCVQVQRLIDNALEGRRGTAKSPREVRILSSGNRVLSGLVFRILQTNRLSDPSFALHNFVDAERVKNAVDTIAGSILDFMHDFYAKAMIPNFFRNQAKSRELFDYVGKKHTRSQIFSTLISSQKLS